MRKKREKLNGLFIVRKATGLSQQKFAAAVGATKATIENIELCRQKKGGDGLAEAIGAFTGVVPSTILSDDGPKDFANEPYSCRSWEKWQKIEFTDKEIVDISRHGHDALSVLLEVAARNSMGQPTPQVFRTILIALNRFVFEQVKNHRLEARVQACMQDRSKLDEGETTVEQARAAFRKSPAWIANERREWKSSTKVHYKVQSIPQFIPFFGFARLDGIPVFFNHFRKVRRIFDLTVAGGRPFRVLRDDVESSITFSTKSELSKKLQSVPN